MLTVFVLCSSAESFWLLSHACPPLRLESVGVKDGWIGGHCTVHAQGLGNVAMFACWEFDRALKSVREGEGMAMGEEEVCI